MFKMLVKRILVIIHMKYLQKENRCIWIPWIGMHEQIWFFNFTDNYLLTPNPEADPFFRIYPKIEMTPFLLSPTGWRWSIIMTNDVFPYCWKSHNIRLGICIWDSSTLKSFLSQRKLIYLFFFFLVKHFFSLHECAILHPIVIYVHLVFYLGNLLLLSMRSRLKENRDPWEPYSGRNETIS